MATPTADIALIGLAVMGENLVLNMESRGFTVAVFNRTTARVDAFVSGRAKGKKIVGAHSVEELAAALKPPRKIMIMVKAGTAVDEVIDELVPLLKPGDILIDGGNSHFPDSTRRTQEAKAKGIGSVDAPVSGGDVGAKEARLSIMVGGDAEVVEAIRPLLECMGNRIVHAGGQGMGASLKMVMNQLLGTVMAAFAEGLVLGQSLGLSQDVLFEALLNGPAAAPLLAAKRKRIESEDYEEADFPLQWLQKDLHLASVSAYESGVAMPLTNVAKEIYRLVIREGEGEKDFSAICGYLAQEHGRLSAATRSGKEQSHEFEVS